MRTDDNNNPTAMTTQVAAQGGLKPGLEFTDGTDFPRPSNLVTAKLIGDPVQLTIRVIDAVGYQTRSGEPRWSYIDLPKFVWDSLSPTQKRDVIGYHYRHEGGTTMRHLFPNWSAV